MGEIRKTDDRALLRLGAQMAEVEALFACVLDTPDAQAEGRALRDLAGAGARLAELALDMAGGKASMAPARRVPKHRVSEHRVPEHRRPARTRLERRIARVQVTTEWIIAQAGGHQDRDRH
ncbi:hypothetical protein GCM10010191_06050 [Actinomadura vinacea]|uniref:Transposase n=1 Tax=Actinomadura vinacea TaxID=115336 RepID=A0ABN3ID92_9ACTN